MLHEQYIDQTRVAVFGKVSRALSALPMDRPCHTAAALCPHRSFPRLTVAPVEGGLSTEIDRQERVSCLCAELHSDSLGSAGLRPPTVSGLPTRPCLCPVVLPKTRDQVHLESLSSGCCGLCWVPPGVFSCLCPLVLGESASPGTSQGSREGTCFMKWGVTGKHSEPHGLASVCPIP